ncbi:MAG TPA: RtcB family protein [Verrucomicrobiales bacterium]|nr:RtcB family protein [Verrucomicrobiales bacterium]
MALLNGHDILAAGWPPGPHITKILEAVRGLEEKGIVDADYALKLLRREFPPPPSKMEMRREPADLAEAIEAAGPEDASNIGAVRRLMNELLRTPVIERGAVMPDACPAGSATATIPVGGAIAVRNAIIPSAHSADICCSMFATFFRSSLPVSEQLDRLTDATRFGMGGRKEEDWVPHPVLDESVLRTNPFLTGLERHARMHMADQGDGNHFAYIGRVTFTQEALDRFDAAGHTDFVKRLTDAAGGRLDFEVLVTHHGSRGIGAQLYKRGQNAALNHTKRVAAGVPDAAAWLDFSEREGQDYWEALQYVSRWTLANHQSIHARFLERIASPGIATMGNEHNFVWKRGDHFLHGKGATPAWRDEAGRPLAGLIPLNMAAPILMVLGKDNAEYLSFAPHGAGRNLSRTALVRPYRDRDGQLDERRIADTVKSATTGLDIRWFCGKPDLSESPMGYKPAAQVKAQIQQFGLADVVAEIQPLGCIMAGDAGPRPWQRLKEELTPKQKRQIEHRADRRTLKQHLRHGDWPSDEE